MAAAAEAAAMAAAVASMEAPCPSTWTDEAAAARAASTAASCFTVWYKRQTVKMIDKKTRMGSDVIAWHKFKF